MEPKTPQVRWKLNLQQSHNVSAEDCEYFYDTMANLRDSAVEARNSGDEAGYDFYDDAMYEVLRTMPEEC